MSNTFLVVIVVLSLLTTVGTVSFLVWRIRKDKQTRIVQITKAYDPVLREAENLKESLGPLLLQVKQLRDALVEGKVRSDRAQALYEIRVKQLEAEIEKKS